MKKLTSLLVAGVSVGFSTSLFAATELTKAQAEALVPFRQIQIKGRYLNSIDATNALARRADKEHAVSYYIVSTAIYKRNESLRLVTAKLYKANAAKTKPTTVQFRNIKGVLEYSKNYALQFEPFSIIRLNSYFSNPYSLTDKISKLAAEKSAYAFYIDQKNEHQNNTTEVVAYLFKKDAPKRKLQPKNAIPIDSESAKIANKTDVERVDSESPTEFDQHYYEAKFSGKSISNENYIKPRRFTITLPNGQKIQELNDGTAQKMIAFSTIRFRGYYTTDFQISQQVAKRAARQGAKYYHITQILQDTRGPNKTITADLYH